jgi:hypothetical protein
MPKSTTGNNMKPGKQRMRHKSPDGRTNARTNYSDSSRIQFEELFGRGSGLWNDEEFARFQAWLRDSRSGGER